MQFDSCMQLDVRTDRRRRADESINVNLWWDSYVRSCDVPLVIIR